MSEDTPIHTTRESWLLALVARLRPHVENLGYGLPEKLQISCGFPSTKALSTKGRRLAECWSHEASRDGTTQILISPTVDDALRVADIVVHELGHASGIPGHKGDFKAYMRKLGLEGKATATTASPELSHFLQAQIAPLGPYPHASIDALSKPKEKPQTTRMNKISCAKEHEAYILRGSKATFAKGIPDCPVCGGEMDLEEKDGGEEEA